MTRQHNVSLIQTVALAALALTMTASLAGAQEASPPVEAAPDIVTRAFEVNTVDPHEFVRIMGAIASKEVSMAVAEGTPAFIVVSGPKKLLDAIGELLDLGGFGDASAQPATRIFTLEHAYADRILDVLSVFLSPGVEIRAGERDLNAIAVSGPPGAIQLIAKGIESLDVPPPPPAPKKNIELTVHLLLASSQAGSIQAEAFPALLADVVSELKNTFSYGHYRLWDAMLVRCRDGENAEASWMVPSGEAGAENEFGPSILKFQARQITLQDGGGEGRTIMIDDLTMGAEIPLVVGSQRSGGTRRVSRHSTGLSTHIDVREGQTVVVGKASVGASSDEALFVVLTAKVLD